MGPVGVQEMVVIFLVALVLFGPKKLPELGKTLAKAMNEFRRAQSDLKATFDREMQALERESESLKEATRQASVDISGFSDIDLFGGATQPNHSLTGSTQATESIGGTAQAALPPSFTVSASAVPGAESPTEAELAAIQASLQNPAAAATEPGPTSGQPEPEPVAVTTGVPGTVPRSATPVQAPQTLEAAQTVPADHATAHEAERHT